MLKIKYERYWNDYHRVDEEAVFPDLTGLEEWIFGQMKQNYTAKQRVMSFPTPEAAKRIHSDGPWTIEFTPQYGGPDFWIHTIATSKGIIFSDGKYTAGQTHWSKDVQAWLEHCEQRRKTPTFNFVD